MMKKILYPILSSLAHYYDKGSTKSIAYENSLLVTILFLTINLFSILNLFQIDFKYFDGSESRIQEYLKYIIAAIPVFFLLKKFYSKEELLKEHSKDKLRRMNAITIIYMASTVVLMIVVVEFK